MIRFLTAGESHGKAVTGIAEGFPAGVEITEDFINSELQRRRDSVGRGGRAKIEPDTATLLSGVRGGITIGSPITVSVKNNDYPNWEETMASSSNINEEPYRIYKPRPGHADLPGLMKYSFSDARNVLERASARETVARVAIGAIAIKMLQPFGIIISSYVNQIGKAVCPSQADLSRDALANMDPLTRCPDEQTSKSMYEEVEKAKTNGDSLGGLFTVLVYGVPPGLGSYVHWDRRLDANLAQAIMSIPAIKSVEVGAGRSVAELPGSQVMDEILFDTNRGFFRSTNNMGGIEGGMSNGETISITAAMKPIPTIKKGLKTVDLHSKSVETAHYERSDVCAVPRAAVIGESMAALVVANALIEKFGGDSVEEMLSAFNNYKSKILWGP